MNLIRQQIGNTLCEGIHGDSSRPEYEIICNVMGSDLPIGPFDGVHHAIRVDCGHPSRSDDINMIPAEFVLQ